MLNTPKTRLSEGSFFYFKSLVYDRKMLDRANLFIDERVDSMTGEYVLDMEANETMEDYINRLNALDWNGSNQTTISPFTYFNYDTNVDTNTPTFGAVAYSYADQDSVAEYNSYVTQQLDLIRWYYSYDNPKWNDPDNPDDNGNPANPHPEWANWAGPDNVPGPIQGHLFGYTDDTLAPGASWDNYLWHGTTCISEVPVLIDGDDRYPYQAGFSLYSFLTNNYSWYKSGKSAGVDCVGLVQRAASYEDNHYSLPDIGAWPWTNNNTEAAPYYGPRRMLVIDSDPHRDYYHLWEISRKNGEEIPVNLDKVVPGDIMYYWEDNGTPNNLSDDPYHVAMVYKVEFNDNSRNTQISQIYLIESTYGARNAQRFGRVIKFYSINDYNNSKNWKLGRLIVN